MPKKPHAIVLDLNELVEQTQDYRDVIWTGQHLQMTTMTIKRGESVGWEVHNDTDQMLLVKKGHGVASFGKTKNGTKEHVDIYPDCTLLVPAGTWHDISNTGKSRLKIVSLYAPPHH